MSDPMNEWCGHKTFRNADGSYRHEPLSREEADAIWKQVEESRLKRAELYPDEKSAIRAMFNAYERLRELGWKDSAYAPTDRKIRKTVSVGSTGIHDAYCELRPPPAFESRWWWHPSEDGDLWPHSPILYKDRP